MKPPHPVKTLYSSRDDPQNPFQAAWTSHKKRLGQELRVRRQTSKIGREKAPESNFKHLGTAGHAGGRTATVWTQHYQQRPSPCARSFQLGLTE